MFTLGGCPAALTNAVVTTLALGGWLMAPITPAQLVSLLALVAACAVALDPLKVRAFARLGLLPREPRP